MKIQILLSSVLAFEMLNNFLLETILRVGWTRFGFPVSFCSAVILSFLQGCLSDFLPCKKEFSILYGF